VNASSSDPQLLRDYAERRSEAAFAELVRRHIDFVHSVALRMVNDPHLAKDVSQGVFVALAKNAGHLTSHPVLSGWLHRAARNIAAQTVRTEVRRRHREQQAAAMNVPSETDAQWEEIAPQLDTALADLSDSDRDAVLLRYFENKPAQEMAAILGISTDAAQKRVNRAVEKLRDKLTQRGVASGAAGLTGIISANAVQAAPAGLAASISSTAVTGTVATVVATSALRKAIVALAMAASIGAAIDQSIRVSTLRAENESLQQTYPRQAVRIIRPRAIASATQPGGAEKEGPIADSQQVIASSSSTEFSLIAPAGKGITTGAAEVAGLNPQQKKAVDRMLRAIWNRVSDDFASRAVMVTAESDPKAGLLVYNIPARTDRGREFVRQLESSLDAEVGETKRKLLMKGIKTSDFLGGFGALNVRLKFAEGHGCDYAISKPGSGESVQTGSMDFDSFIDRFGDSFELPRPDTYPTYR
jgi:RNA polymerase sigma factor (sigma-70 family)